jgi:hypothetical protein
MAAEHPNKEMMDRLSSVYYDVLKKQVIAEGEKLQLFTPFRPLSAGADDANGDRRLAIQMDGRPVKALVVNDKDRDDMPPEPAPARAPAAPARAPARAPGRAAQHLTAGYYAVYGTLLSHLKVPEGADAWVKTLKSEKAPTEKNAEATEFNNWQAFLTESRKTDKTSTIGELLQNFVEVRSTCK